MEQAVDQDYRFDRPIIIVAAPRSGSTLLFETLSCAQSLWTIGGESHAVLEHVRKLNPAFGHCDSNRLTADDADDQTVARLRGVFFDLLRGHNGRAWAESGADPGEKPRFMEKTPKNALRIPFLERVFPDARYIYLFRDPRENLSSMIEAWRSLDFVTYASLPDWPGNWSLLLPPGYGAVRGKPLEEIVAFQWAAANRQILEDLDRLAADRWSAVSYAELVSDPATAVERLCEFAAIEFDESLRARCGENLPLSRYTKSAPEPEKWRRNEAMIERVMPGLQPLVDDIETAVQPFCSSEVLLTGAISSLSEVPAYHVPEGQGRNDPCACGSGLRFKHCHGRL